LTVVLGWVYLETHPPELKERPKAYEEPPEWAKGVLGKALAETVFIPNAVGRTSNEDCEDVSKEFKDVGVIVQMPHSFV
jgi:hypothetical protein